MSDELARLLERRIGRGGGSRDTVPGSRRNVYVTVSVAPEAATKIDTERQYRGLSRAAFLGMIVESALSLGEETLDLLLSRGAE